MTKFVTCFDDYIDDGLPWDWSARWNIARNTSPLVLYLTHPAASDVVPVKRRCMRIETYNPAGGGNLQGAVSWDRVGSVADFELLTFVSQFADSSTALGRGVVFRFRASGVELADQNGYDIRVTNDRFVGTASHILLNKTVRGVQSAIANVAVSNNGTNDLPVNGFFVRIKVLGTSIKARAWTGDYSTEPAAWDLDTTDSSISQAGWLGWEAYWDTVDNNVWTDMNFLSVATAGETVQQPMTNAAFTAWLSQAAQRCYIFEASAVGYASGGGVAGNFTKTSHLYASSVGYVSQAWDYPPSQQYMPIITKIPSFKRDMGVALSGKASVGFGSVVLANPATTQLAADVMTYNGITGIALVGPRENWLRMHWRKNFAKVWYGDQTWPKHDFRPFLVGRLQPPRTGADNSEIEFPITDLSDLLTLDANPRIFTSGDYAGQRYPRIYGSDRGATFSKTQIEPPRIDLVNRKYQLSSNIIGAWYTNSSSFLEVYDNQVAIFHTADRTITAVSGLANTFTDNGHGMLNGWVVVFSFDAGPGTNTGLIYYVANATANTFQLSDTQGGAARAFAGTNTAGSIYRGFGYTVDIDGDGVVNIGATNPPFPLVTRLPSPGAGATMQLVSPAVGRVTVSNVAGATIVGGAIDTTTNDQRTLFNGIALDAGLGRGMIDAPDTLSHATKCICSTGPGKVSADEVLARISTALLCWYGFSQDGFLQYGEVLLPFTPTVSLTQSDVKAGSLKKINTKLAWDLRTAQLYLPWFIQGGAFQTGSPQALQGRVVYPAGTFSSATGIPLDSHPQLSDLDQTINQELLFTDTFTYYKTLFALPIGTFTVQVSMKAAQAKIGSAISLVHPREEWLGFNGTTYPASPDNTTPAISSLATVVGIEINPSASDPYPVTLTLFRQLLGYYPTGDVLGNYLTEDILEEDGVTVVLEEDGVTHTIEEGGYSG